MTHLTSKKREEIYALKQEGRTQKEIAEMIGCSQSTISKEIKRNHAGPRLGYLPDRANKIARNRRKQAKNKVTKWYEHKPLEEIS